jgi:hypothetical protein
VVRLRLVPLAHRTGPHEGTDDAAVVLNEKLRAEAKQRLLDALVAPCVGELEDVVEDRRGARHEDAALVQQQPLVDAPGVTVGVDGHSVATST